MFYQVDVRSDLGMYSIISTGAGLTKDSIEKVPSVAKLIVPIKVIPDICHRHHRRCLWKTNLPCGEFHHMTNCQLEKCLHMENMEKNLLWGEMWRKISHVENNLHMRNVETSLFYHNLCCFVIKSVWLPFMLFCRQIYFVAIHTLLRGEKLNQKIVSVEKKRQISGMIKVFMPSLDSLDVKSSKMDI